MNEKMHKRGKRDIEFREEKYIVEKGERKGMKTKERTVDREKAQGRIRIVQ